MAKTKKTYRSAITGRFISKAEAEKFPANTYSTKLKSKKLKNKNHGKKQKHS